MFRLPCSKIPSLRFLATRVSSSLPRPTRYPLKPSFARKSFTTTTTAGRLPSLDPKSLMVDPESELFNHTAGRFLSNESLRLQERRRVFNVPGLFKIIAEALNCKTEDIVDFQKLGEGRLNRAFLITLDTGFQLVARIPYTILIPKGYALASEVATMDFLRLKGLPIPKVYAYSFESKNEAETEYILMEYVRGVDLSQVWFDLEKDDVVSLMDQLVVLESIMMSISFPAGGNIYYTKDLKHLSGNEGIPLEMEQFCMGPDVSVPLWYGRREQLNVFRGPYKDAKSVLVAGAEKELAYLDQFGSPRLPHPRFRGRVFKGDEKQSPSDYAEILHCFLSLAPSLVPDDDSLNAFCIRWQPDLGGSHLKISTHPNGLRIIGILDWQHVTVLPIFLHAGMPDDIWNNDKELEDLTEPKLPDDFDELSGVKKSCEMRHFLCLLVRYRYYLSTAAYNRILYESMLDPLNVFRRRIFRHASAVWEGTSIKLLFALMEMESAWAAFAKDDTPCPVVFTHTEDEKALTEGLYRAMVQLEGSETVIKHMITCGEDTLVPADCYEEAKKIGQEMKQMALKSCAMDTETTDETYASIEANWPLDDVDEEKLEEYK